MFPEIRHIDEVLPHVEGRQDFAVKRSESCVAIDYIYAGDGTFDLPILRECRGIKFDAKTGEILARPYHKFFNLNEKPETQEGAIDWSSPHVVLDKLDGSMIHPALVGGRLAFMTRAGETEIALDAAAHAERVGISGWCADMLRGGVTPIFEWCSPRNQIVVRYPTDALTLTGLRETITGRYLPLDGSGPAAVQQWGSNLSDLTAFLAYARALEDAEGYVVRFASGFMIKVKADAYVARHRARDGMALEKNVLRLVLDGGEDDVIPLLPPEEAERLQRYSYNVQMGISRAATDLLEFVGGARREVGEDRKRFALEAVPTLPKLLQGPAFSVWMGKEPNAVLRELVAKHCGSGPDVEHVRSLLGDARWTGSALEAA